MKRKKIIIITSAGILGMLLLLALSVGGIYYHYIFRPCFHPTAIAYVHIDRDDTADSVYHKLKTAGNPARFKGILYLARKYDYADNIQTGRYAIHPGDNAHTLFFHLLKGRQAPKNLVVGSVRTRNLLARNLAKQLMADSAEIAAKLYDPAFCQQLGFTEETIMCLFIPNTYQVYWNIGTDDLFTRMQKEYNRFWNQDRLTKAQSIGLAPKEVSTLASIVEEETNHAGESPMVAGLYLNRLKKGMLLQADPTVKFGLQNFELRRITNSHLTVSSPYNTYKHVGLPPGPIRNPSIRTIDSVLDYTPHDYIYMCAKEDFSGTHNFASNLEGHNVNARKYWKALNDRKIFK